MTSIFANLFTLLQSKLATIPTGTRPFHVDHDNGQLEDEKPAIGFPAILIDFDNFQWQNLGSQAKMGEGMVVLKLVFAPYSGSSNITNPVFKEKGLNYYELEQAVKSALDGWCPDETTDVYSPMCYEAVTTSKLRTDLRIREMAFSIGIDDYSDVTQPTYTPATIVITPEINTSLE